MPVESLDVHTIAPAGGDGGEFEQNLQLAGQVQHALLPKSLPDTDALSIFTLYRPADHVSGDIYDIARLDETRVGIWLADVTGHGLPAALLTFLLKQTMCAKEIFDRSYRIVEPDELLGRLNDDLLSGRLKPCRLITGLHAVYDRSTSVIRWARGGCPYPILIRSGQPARLCASDGGLIGAFPQQFETISCKLEPGDSLVLYTDGVEALLLDRREAPARTLLDTSWIRVLETAGPKAALDALENLAESSSDSDWPADDITVIALQMN